MLPKHTKQKHLVQKQECLEFMQALRKQVVTKLLSLDTSLHPGDTKTVIIANTLVVQLTYYRVPIQTDTAPSGRAHPPIFLTITTPVIL